MKLILTSATVKGTRRSAAIMEMLLSASSAKFMGGGSVTRKGQLGNRALGPPSSLNQRVNKQSICVGHPGHQRQNAGRSSRSTRFNCNEEPGAWSLALRTLSGSLSGQQNWPNAQFHRYVWRAEAIV